MNEALDMIKKILGINSTDYDVMLTQMLESSKANCKGGTVMYRPYIVSAFFFMTYYAEVMRDRVGRGGLLEADGAKFVNPLDILEKTVPGYLRLDKALMCSGECSADKCWDADTLLNQLQCGCDANKKNTYGISYMVL